MPTIEEIRQKFPQYGDMTDGQLADALYAKSYSDLPREQFNKAIGFNPVSPFDYVGNVKSAVASGVENIKKGISPQTIEGGSSSIFPSAPLDIAKGVVQIATSPISAASRAYGGAIEAGTGGIIPADQAELSLLALGPKGGPLPRMAPANAASVAGAADKELAAIAGQETTAPKPIPAGKENVATLADVVGGRGQDTIERLAQTPGAARAGLEQFLTDRQKEQLSRVSNDLRDTLGVKNGAFQTIERTIKERNAAAAPAYDQAYKDGDFAIWNQSPVFEQIASAKPVRDAMAAAVNDWELNAVADKYGAMNPRAAVEGGGIIKFKDGGIPAFPNLQFWDYTKQALDKAISAEINLKTGEVTRRGANLLTVKNALTSALDQIVPSYAQARASWGGRSEYISAINFGKTINNVGADEWAGMIAGMNEAQKEGARIGLASEILKKAGNRASDMTDITQFFRSPEMRQKISAIMPNQEAAVKWQNALDFEANSSALVGKSLRGSQTARRTLEAADATKMAGDLVLDMFAGAKTTIAKKIIQGTYGAIRDRLRSSTDQELAKRFMQPPRGTYNPSGSFGGGYPFK